MDTLAGSTLSTDEIPVQFFHVFRRFCTTESYLKAMSNAWNLSVTVGNGHIECTRLEGLLEGRDTVILRTFSPLRDHGLADTSKNLSL
jgi:hypothetical protein